MQSSGAAPVSGADRPTPRDGVEALREHVVLAAARAREALGPIHDETLALVLEDTRLTRYPVTLVFGEAALRVGEIGFAELAGDDPAEGWRLVLHPALRRWPGAATEVALYQLVVVIYGELAEAEHAEAFGAALLGLERDEYYRRLCTYADGIWWPGAA